MHDVKNRILLQGLISTYTYTQIKLIKKIGSIVDIHVEF